MIKSDKRERCRGVALAEAALVLMVLMLVTLGAVEYGWVLFNLQRVTNAARHGARLESAADADDAVDDIASTAMELLLDDLPATCTVVTDSNIVSATVFVPASAVRLVHWDLLPVPDLDVTVEMHKEGN